MLGHSDAYLDFGTLSLAAGTQEFPNIIKPKESSLSRFYVSVTFAGAKTSGGKASISLYVANNGTTYTEVAKTAEITDFSKSAYIAIPEHTNKASFKAKLTVTGTFTGGTAKAEIDTYTGV